MAKCDLCNENAPASSMEQLLERYQIPGVVDLCPKCAKWVNKTKDDLLLAVTDALKQKIAEKKHLPPRANSILGRIFK